MDSQSSSDELPDDRAGSKEGGVGDVKAIKDGSDIRDMKDANGANGAKDVRDVAAGYTPEEGIEINYLYKKKSGKTNGDATGSSD